MFRPVSMSDPPLGAIPIPPAMGLCLRRVPQQGPPPSTLPNPFGLGFYKPTDNLEEVPLKNVTVKATLTGYCAATTSVLSYVNSSSEPMEVLFRFPVDEAYAVVGLEAVLGGRKIKATLKEKEEARQEYDDAIASGYTAALGEEKTGDIFSILLGNLPPQSDAQILLRLVAVLPLDAEGRVVFSLPTVLKPRYTPSNSTNPLQSVQGATHTTQHAVFEFSLEVMNALTVSDVTSSTHTLTSQRDGDKLLVSVTESTPLTKDVVVLVTHTEPHMPTAISELGNSTLGQRTYMGSPAVMVNFFPAFESKRAACEFIFVIDRSGSMSGGFMASAKETLKLFLRSIPPGCYFNVIGFGSTFKVMFGWSEEYNQASLDRAIQETNQMFANLGGTELLTPLKHIYSLPLLPGLPRQVFVLTDGSVSNTNACIKEVQRHVSHTRVFTFGIGSGASTELVRGLACAGNGTAEFIQEGERMQPKVMASLKRALQPAVTDLKVVFDVPSGFEVLQAPATPPVVFSGDKTTVFGILKSKVLSDEPLIIITPISGTARLSGQVLGKPFELAIPFSIPETSLFDGAPPTVVHQLASKALIRDWQDSSSRRKEVIELSIESSVISSQTAYVAVDEDQDQPIQGAVKVWDILAIPPQHQLAASHGFGHSPKMKMMASNSAGSHSRSQGLSSDLFSFSGNVDLLGGPPPLNTSNNLFSGGPPPPPMGGGLGGLGAGGLGGGLSMGGSLCLGGGPPPPPRGGGSFGGPPPPPGGGGLFGGPPPPSGGGELFGGPPPPSGGLCLDGGPPPPPGGGGLFGGPPPSSGGGLFGGPSLGGLQQTSLGSSQPTGGTALQTTALFGSSSTAAPIRSVTTTTSPSLLTTIISLQQAQGYWHMEEVASQVFQQSVSNLMAECPLKCDAIIWATMLVVVYLEAKFEAEKDEWELIAMKAEMWLEDSVSGDALTQLRDAAKSCM